MARRLTTAWIAMAAAARCFFRWLSLFLRLRLRLGCGGISGGLAGSGLFARLRLPRRIVWVRQ